MDPNDIPISPVGVENPRIHTISVNGNSFNVAIELQSITLLGASFNSVNTEYRQFNLDNKATKELFNSSNTKPSHMVLFHQLKKLIDAKTKKNAIIIGDIEVTNVAYRGIDYAIIYYLLIKKFRYSEEQFVTLNSFTNVIPIISLFDKIVNTERIKLNHEDLKSFAQQLTKYQGSTYIGSKLFSITRQQMLNTNDLSQSIWKSMYINRILRNIPIESRTPFFAPTIGWGIIRCVAKHVFTNTNLISKVAFGENIDFIRSSSKKQRRLASQLILGQVHDNALNDIKRITNELYDATDDIDYALGDIIIAMFYPHVGRTLFTEISRFIEDAKLNKNVLKSDGIISMALSKNDEAFESLIFQYLYSTYLLAKYGIIHNDPHLNNILIAKNKSFGTKKEFVLSSNNIIAINCSDINLTLIDYDKAILSHRHTNSFDITARMINEEISIVFNDDMKKTISSDYNQVFNCYVMYDVVKFCLVMKEILEEVDKIIGQLFTKNVLSKKIEFLDKILKLSLDTLYKIYSDNPKFPFNVEDSHGSIEWLISTIYKDYKKVNKTKSSVANATQLARTVRSTSNPDRPEFISSRRKYADALKYNFISEYASNVSK